VADVRRSADGYVVTKATDASWRDIGGVVEAAIRAAVAALADGSIGAERPTDAAVRDVIEESVGELLRSHGGSIEVVSVNDATVTLALHGACSGCAAAGTTVDDVVAAAVVRRFPGVTRIDRVRC
jgi:NFU1 iron-sulfur cluster scaffold homolog, mitochondrial